MNRNRRADWRRIKSLLSYTVEEAARKLEVHRGTVRHWIKSQGLPVLTERRPHLILGRDLVAFLRRRREASKTKCGRGEFYCLKCRAPRKPVEGLLEFRRDAASRRVLMGICSQCETLLRRFVSDRRAAAVADEFGVQLQPGHESLSDSGIPALTCDYERTNQP